MAQADTPETDSPWWQREWLVALALYVVVSSVFFATITGVTASNDGDHYALVRALVEDRSFEITPYLSFTEFQDYAVVGDRYFSHAPPGTALIASPLYALSAVAPPSLVALPSRHDAANPRMIYAVATAALAAAGAVVLFYLTLRQHFDIPQPAALFTAAALAFGTTTWKYGSVLYSHAQMALALWVLLYLLFALERRPEPRPALLFGLGFALGAAPVIEYSSVLMAALVGLYLIAVLGRTVVRGLKDPASRRGWLVGLGLFVLGAAIPLGFLMIYNTLNFGGPFELSSYYVDLERWPTNERFATQFSTPLWVGLPAMLFYGDNNQGLFLLSPVALLGLAGLLPLVRYLRAGGRLRQGLLMLAVFVVMLSLFSKYATFNPLTDDSRYLTPFVGLWFVAVASGVALTFSTLRAGRPRWLLGLLVYGLLLLSIRNQLLHIAFSWNYALDLSTLRPMAIAPENTAAVLGTVFRNAGNLPLLWAGEALAVGLIGAAVCAGRHLRPAARKQPRLD